MLARIDALPSEPVTLDRVSCLLPFIEGPYEVGWPRGRVVVTAGRVMRWTVYYERADPGILSGEGLLFHQLWKLRDLGDR